MLSVLDTQHGQSCWLTPFGTVDWNPCFRAEILNGVVPLALLAASGAWWFVSSAVVKKKRQAELAREVANLNPESSNFYHPTEHATEETPLAPQPPKPNAAQRVFQTENAVLIDAALAIKETARDSEVKENCQRAQRVKSLVDLAGAALICLTHVAGSALSAEWEARWIVFWVYATALSATSVWKHKPMIAQKVLLSSVYLVVMVSNLRTSFLAPTSQAVRVVTAVQTTLAVTIFVVIVTTPVTHPLPSKLTALYNTMHKQTHYEDLRTAMPTPPHEHDEETITASYSKDTQPLPTPPEQYATLFGRALFTFVQPIILKYYRTPITLPDVPQIMAGDRAAAVTALFRTNQCADIGTDSKYVPLWRRLIQFFAPMLVYQGMCGLVATVLTLLPIVFLSRLLNFFTLRAEGGPDAPPLHMGVLYASGMFFSQVFFSIVQSQGLMTGRHVCSQIRSILTFEILSKTMRRSISAKNGSSDEDAEDSKEKGDEEEQGAATDGQVTNLVSVDVSQVAEFSSYIHQLFPQEPLSVVLGIVYLINLLGMSAAVGLILLVLTIPLQSYLIRLSTEVSERMLKATDARLDLAGEVLACIKTVKFFAWEKPFEVRMAETRQKELNLLRFNNILQLFISLTFVGTPMLVTMATFGVHTLVFKKTLTAETAFTALALFNTLRAPLTGLPGMIHWMLGAIVSVRRVDKYMQQPDTTKYEQLLSPSSEADLLSGGPDVIGFKNATFTYASEQDAEDQFKLRDITCSFPAGEISLVVGPVGSGKTSILLALMGELRRVKGETVMPWPIARSMVQPDPHTHLAESAAYCSQSAWLLGTTVHENILFGAKYDESRYREVLKACALEPDLDILEFHDETEVGEKGTSLSGGQKARISLARAFYSNAKYILIDDALSAVDAHTARHLCEKCFRGPLAKGRTIVLVTHAVTLMLPNSAYVVVMDGGRISAQGKPSVLLAQGQIREMTSTKNLAEETHEEEQVQVEEDEALKTQRWEKALESRKRKENADKNEEKISREQSSLSLYKLYMGSVASSGRIAVIIWVTIVSMYVTIRAMEIGSGAWLRDWARSYDSTTAAVVRSVHTWATATLESRTQTLLREDNTVYYLKGYALIFVAFMVMSFVCYYVQYQASLWSSTRLYNRLIRALLLAKPQFYDKTPIGRITNRLARDTEELDRELSFVLLAVLEYSISLVSIIGVICWATPKFFFLLGFVLAMYYAIGTLYLSSSRVVKRIESVQRSPLYTLVGETISGMVTIRAYSDGERVMRQCLSLIDKWNRAFLLLWYENRWLSIYCDLSGALVTFSASLFLLLSASDAALAGFTLSYAITLVEVVLWLVRLYANVEISLNSVERIGEYIDIPSENRGGLAPPAHWPTDTGAIEIKDLSVRYGPEFPLALTRVAFSITPGEKVGIVGRTGSGKSTLSLAFFRFLEAESGSIVIDGIDISTITLEALRSRLTIIPQDSQLFKGTVRSNLDPFGACEDAEMWFALQRCQLASGALDGSFTPSDTSVVKSLDDEVDQGGANFSAGQRQLLSLARGLLKMRNSRILILDESTANLDSESDALIQRTIREQMAPGATILTVAHRLKTIIDYDKVLVLDKGHVLEYDSPNNLLKKSSSSFFQLCSQSGDLEELVQLAEAASASRAL